MMREGVAAAVLFVLVLAGCASEELTPGERIGDIIACEAAIVAAGLPIAMAVTDQTSTNPAKAKEAHEILAKANALPACLKVGANAATVLGEQKKMRGLSR